MFPRSWVEVVYEVKRKLNDRGMTIDSGNVDLNIELDSIPRWQSEPGASPGDSDKKSKTYWLYKNNRN